MNTDFKKIICNEKGGAFLALIVTLPFILLIGIGIVVDVGRGISVKGKLQTACDAASLAGASTATATPITSNQITSDANGNITGINVVVTGWNINLDPTVALQAARDTFLQNQQTGLLSAGRGVIFTQQELNGSNEGWHGEVTGSQNDAYLFKAQVKVKTVFLGPLCDFMWSNKSYYQIPVYAESYSKPKLYTN